MLYKTNYLSDILRQTARMIFNQSGCLMVNKKIFQFVLFPIVIFGLFTGMVYSRSLSDLLKPKSSSYSTSSYEKECKLYLEPSKFKRASPVRFVFETKASGTLVFYAEGSEEFTELHLVVGDSRRLFAPIRRSNIVGIVESPEWQNLFKHFPIYLTAKTRSNNYTSSVYQRMNPMEILISMEKKCGLFIEDIPSIKQKRWAAEQNLNLHDLEKKFIIWALKRHFPNWDNPNEFRKKLKQFSYEHNLPPSRFLSAAIIRKLKEKNGFAILPQYEGVGLFYKGVTVAKLNERWGLIDRRGNWILLPIYEEIGGYQEGYLPVMRDGLWGLINHKGVLVLPISYKKMMDCSEQRCGVKLEDKWGYVDTSGALIIWPQYDKVNKFRDSYAAVKKDGQWLLINRQGYVQYTFSIKKLYSPSEGLSTFQDYNNKRGFINISGNIVISSQFKRVERFSEGLAAVYNGKKWGFVDSRGKIKIPFEFKGAQRFTQKIAPAKGDSGQWGYIDKSGDWVIFPRFNRAFPFDNGIATVRVDNPSGENPYRGFINKEGSFYYDPIFEDVYQFREGLAPVKLWGYWGFISKRLIEK